MKFLQELLFYEMFMIVYTNDCNMFLLVWLQETVRTSSGQVTSTRVEDIDLDQCWDERLLRQLVSGFHFFFRYIRAIGTTILIVLYLLALALVL